jgi:hypothetical protein
MVLFWPPRVRRPGPALALPRRSAPGLPLLLFVSGLAASRSPSPASHLTDGRRHPCPPCPGLRNLSLCRYSPRPNNYSLSLSSSLCPPPSADLTSLAQHRTLCSDPSLPSPRRPLRSLIPFSSSSFVPLSRPTLADRQLEAPCAVLLPFHSRWITITHSLSACSAPHPVLPAAHICQDGRPRSVYKENARESTQPLSLDCRRTLFDAAAPRTPADNPSSTAPSRFTLIYRNLAPLIIGRSGCSKILNRL